MKKVVFSAIALLAFTAISFATEVKKEVKKSEAKNEVKEEVKKSAIPDLSIYDWKCIIRGINARNESAAAGQDASMQQTTYELIFMLCHDPE